MAYETGATERALRYFGDRIRSGEWPEGSRIPTEDQLCEQLEMSRVPVRQAIEKLASISVLKKVQGSGTYVNADRDASVLGLIYYPVTAERVLTVLEFRRMFDPYNIQMFIRNASAEEIEAIEENFREMQAAGTAGDVRAFHRIDYLFHDLIARGTHNMMIVQLSQRLTELLEYYQNEDEHNMGFEHALKYHGLMLEAIRAGNEELASIYCSMHIDNAIQRVRGEIAGQKQVS